MGEQVLESDWRIFRDLYRVAVERYCERVLADVAGLVQDSSRSTHERYRDIYHLMRDRDKELGRVFDGLRRSQMRLQLVSMCQLELVTEDELASFSSDLQRWLKGVLSLWEE